MFLCFDFLLKTTDYQKIKKPNRLSFMINK